MDDRIKSIKETLLSHICAQMGNIYNADCEELGQAIDMIKDLEEACYYHKITEAMESNEKERNTYYYTERYMDFPNKMYYDNESSDDGRMNKSRDNWNRQRDTSSTTGLKDLREGRSPEKRRMYMESKELHMSKDVQMKDLEDYIQELTYDLMDMVKDATPEERQILQQKISTLASKINA